MSDLRIAFEGRDTEPAVHQRRISRLSNEWPTLFLAIQEAVYDGDVEPLAEAIAKEANPLLEIGPTKGGGAIATEHLRDYLDGAIRAWRKTAADASQDNYHLAPYYVDAFQSVRYSILGELLPVEEDDDVNIG